MSEKRNTEILKDGLAIVLIGGSSRRDGNNLEMGTQNRGGKIMVGTTIALIFLAGIVYACLRIRKDLK